MTSSCIDILCCPTTAVDAALLARYECLLSEEEEKRLHNFRSAPAAHEFLIGRALVRTMLSERLKCTPQELQFTSNTEGKPVLSYPVSDWQFNLTHCRDWVVLGLCKGAPIGVDIESYKRRNNLFAIAQRFFSADENHLLAQCSEHEWLDNFFAVWTLKEAHAKALGCGLAKILSCSSMMTNLKAGTIELHVSDAASVAANISSWLYKPDDQSALALIAHGNITTQPRGFRCVPLRAQSPLNMTAIAQGVMPSPANS